MMSFLRGQYINNINININNVDEIMRVIFIYLFLSKCYILKGVYYYES